jgi:hypothetical protein
MYFFVIVVDDEYVLANVVIECCQLGLRRLNFKTGDVWRAKEYDWMATNALLAFN